jgi:hypothetical protein
MPAGSSPSPFGTAINSTNSGASLGQTPAGGFSPTGQNQPAQAAFTGTGCAGKSRRSSTFVFSMRGLNCEIVA